MVNKFLVSFAVIFLSVSLTHAAESSAKKKASSSAKPTTDTAKASAAPAPPKPFKDPVTGLEMVYVKGGCFQMGNVLGDGGSEEKPVHEVCVPDFYLGKFEVTQGQWKKNMGSNPSHNSKCGENCPVDNVSWSDAQDFISKLNGKSGGSKFRLPTEAEWEFAARSGGKSEQYSGGDVLADVAWSFIDFDGVENNRWGTKSVGTKRPNGLGIYDMTGNVWEWTNDWYGSDYYSSSPRNNPTGPVTGDRRVLRGGCWRNGAFDLRTTYRNFLMPGYRNDVIGFRLVRMM